MKHLFFSFCLLLVINFAIAQEYKVYKAPTFREEWSKPSYYPDRVVLNFGADPASEANVTWRTDTFQQVMLKLQ